MLKDLFKFPIVMVDGDNEDRKNKLGLGDEGEPDIIIGEAEVPYYDFVSISDRWMPSDESVRKAMDGKFDACHVVFANSGNFVCPWTKERFKRELMKFQEQRDADPENKTPILKHVYLEDLKELLKEDKKNDQD